MSSALTVVLSFLFGVSAVMFGTDFLGRTLLTLGAFYGHLAQ
jgi:hypothetical protein